MPPDFDQPTAKKAATPLSPELERLAQKRVNAQLGWFGHAGIFLAVVSGLALAGWWQGQLWPVAPALGWGLGLAVHAVRVFLVDAGAPLRDRLLQQQRRRLSGQR